LLGSGAAAVEDTSAFAACVEGKSYSRRSEPDPSEPAPELALSSLGTSIALACVTLLLEALEALDPLLGAFELLLELLQIALALLLDALELRLVDLVVLTDALKHLLGLPNLNDALAEGILVAALLGFAPDLLEML